MTTFLFLEIFPKQLCYTLHNSPRHPHTQVSRACDNSTAAHLHSRNSDPILTTLRTVHPTNATWPLTTVNDKNTQG